MSHAEWDWTFRGKWPLGRHTARPEGTWRRWWYPALALLVAIAGTVYLTAGRSARSGQLGPLADTLPPGGAAAFPADTPAPAKGAGPCTAVTVLASLENADMVTALANAYVQSPRDVNGHCVTVSVTRERTGVAATSAAAGFAGVPDASRPTIWLPDSSVWLGIAAQNGAPVQPADAVSVAQSAIVLAMPKTLADAIGWQNKPPSWADIFEAAADPEVWHKLGHHDWGAFKLGKTSPLVATSGLFGLTVSYAVAAGNSVAATAGQVKAPSVQATVKQNELSVSHYMATPEHFLWHARQAEDAGGSAADFLSAVIIDEKSVFDYNSGISSNDGINKTQMSPPKDPLVPIYPTDGSYVADNGAAIVTGAWVTADQKAAAADFLTFSRSAAGQSVVRANGYRDIAGNANQNVSATGSFTKTLTVKSPPATDVLIDIQNSFSAVRKSARVLYLLDVSSSMGNPVAPGVTKLQAAQSAIKESLKYFSGSDQIGLAAFSNADKGPIEPGIVTPVGPLAATGGPFTAALDALVPIAQTPLYAAVSQEYSVMTAAYDPQLVNAIVLLSDGQNDTSQPGDLAAATALIASAHHTAPVLIFTLAYGADADTATLQAIAKSSGAHFYNATDPAQITSVLQDLVTSF